MDKEINLVAWKFFFDGSKEKDETWHKAMALLIQTCVPNFSLFYTTKDIETRMSKILSVLYFQNTYILIPEQTSTKHI